MGDIDFTTNQSEETSLNRLRKELGFSSRVKATTIELRLLNPS